MTPADRYVSLLPGSRVLEQQLAPIARSWSELEIQAKWFAGEFGREFVTADGREVRIVQFGVWNREAGPDFTEAAVSIGAAPPQRGCIELDMDVRDWERHGHATNPAYEHVALHVFLHQPETRCFSRTASNREVPQVRIDATKAADDFPNPVPAAKPGRCVAPLRDLPVEQVRAVLEGAAQFRLQKKAARLARLAEIHGADEALYQSLAAALGYKANQLTFTVLAQKLPLKLLLANRPDVGALLLGVSGFLNAADLSQLDRNTRVYLREVWERWWRRRAEFECLSLSVDQWKFSGQRPANHPQRRVAALAQIVTQWPRLRGLAHRCDVSELQDFFGELHDDYWDHHFTLTSEKSPHKIALIGRSRVIEMLMNVFFPRLLLEQPERWESCCAIPAALTNRPVEIAALRLFGDDTRKREVMKRAVHQQGLLQVYEDFCMRDNSDCERCLFSKQLGRWV